jgi:hypothetical protein
MAWRTSYYGHLLPNTFYAKKVSGWNPSAWADLAEMLQLTLLPFGTAIVAAMIVRSVVKRQSLTAPLPVGVRLVGIIAGAFAIITTLVYVRSNLAMNYSHRFFLPLLPLLLLFGGVILNQLIYPLLERWPIPASRAIAIALLVSLIFQIPIARRSLRQQRRWIVAHEQSMRDENTAIAQSLVGRIPHGEALSVHPDAGIIPYLSGAVSYDFGRLNDEYLAREARTLSDAVNYYFRLRPLVSVFVSYDLDTLRHEPLDSAIVHDPRFREYRLSRRYSTTAAPFQGYHQFVYVRSDATFY